MFYIRFSVYLSKKKINFYFHLLIFEKFSKIDFIRFEYMNKYFHFRLRTDSIYILYLKYNKSNCNMSEYLDFVISLHEIINNIQHSAGLFG